MLLVLLLTFKIVIKKYFKTKTHHNSLTKRIQKTKITFFYMFFVKIQLLVSLFQTYKNGKYT